MPIPHKLASSATSLTIGTHLGPYEILSPLGAGGMGEVYAAKDARLGRRVAVKVLKADVADDPDRLARFEREAKAVAALNHPNILTVHDLGVEDGAPYVVTELLEGESLRQVLSQRSPTQRQVLVWAVQAAQGLAAAHQKGIVHRDLKPENLFLTTDGRIKILDFGLAKLTYQGPSDAKETTASIPTASGVVMGTAAYMSPEQVQGCPVDGRSDIFSLGIVLYELLTKTHPFRRETTPATLAAILQETPAPVTTLDGSFPRALDGIVRKCLEKDRERRFQGSHDLGLALEAVLASPTAAATLDEIDERSPYPGLSSFTEADSSHFFGREEEIKALWEKVRSRRMLAVIGPSGTGKTSFVRAGVVPARPTGWTAIVATPGNSPMRSLGQALAPRLAHDPEALGRLPSFDDPKTAFELLVRWRKAHDDAVVVVDQFEELFTLNPPEVQARVASLLGRLATEADVHVLLSMRDDFLMRCHAHEALAPVFESLTPLGPMTRTGLRRALVEPASKCGYRFEEGALVEEMIDAVEGTRAALPLLAFAVAQLWEKRDPARKLLTWTAYAAIGGVAGALAQHAEATMTRIGSARHDLAREIFRNLVTAQGTRAVLEREELLSAVQDRASADKVLVQLIDARLLTTWDTEPVDGQPARHLVEIVHESLLSSWPRLVRWQTQDADGAQLRDQLRQAARLWSERGKAEDLLWTGSSYLDYRAWRERYAGGLSAAEEEFASGMTALARRKKIRRRVAYSALLTASLIVAAGLATMWLRGVKETRRAHFEAQRAEANKLLAIAQLRFQDDPTEALAFATASLEMADTREARLFALRTLQETPPAWEIRSLVPDTMTPVFSPDGRYLAVGTLSHVVSVWDEKGGPALSLPGHEPNPRGGNVAAWASSDLLVTGRLGAATQVHVWALPGGKKVRTIDFGGPSSWQVGSGRVFAETAVSSSGGNVELRAWRLSDGVPSALGRVDRARLGATSSAFEPNGRGWFYTNGATTHFVPLPLDLTRDRIFSRHGASPVVRSLMNGSALLVQRDENGETRRLSFPESGATLATIYPRPASAAGRVIWTSSNRWLAGVPTLDARLRLWETSSLPGARALDLRRDGSWYASNSSVDSAGRRVVATTHEMSRLTFWALPQQAPSVVDGYKIHLRPLAFSPDAKWLATSWTDSRLRLWPIPGSGSSEVKLLEAQREFPWRGLAFDPKGRFLFAVGGGNNAWIVPLDGSPGRKLDTTSVDTVLEAAAVSPSGRLAATAFFFGKGAKTLRVWDLETRKVRVFDLPVAPPPDGSAPPTPTGYEGGVRKLGFLNESTLVTFGDGGIRRWNLKTGVSDLLLGIGGFASGSLNGRELLFCEDDGKNIRRPASCAAIDVGTGGRSPIGLLDEPGSPGRSASVRPFIATEGPVVALLGNEGSIRLYRRSGGEPLLLLGHTGALDAVAISPDLRWVASSGEDSTLRLWPMPDFSKPPLHTLPREELLAKLKSLTNLRAVRDAASSTGWKIELGPFPGWKNMPEWEP